MTVRPHRVAWLTDPGLERTRNEDSVLVAELGPDARALVVCDGMGGHDAGDVASEAACRRIFEEIDHRADDPDVPGVLVDGLHGAHEAVCALAAARGGSDMGTTAVVARLRGDRLWFAWVGDSRLLLVRDGAVLTSTVDHTVVQRLIDEGELRPEDASSHPDLHVLTQCVGAAGQGVVPAVTDEPVILLPGDRIVLCSDGLHDLVSPAEVAEQVAGRDPEEATRILVELAKARGGHDNVTVVVASYDGTGAPASPDPPVQAVRSEPRAVERAVSVGPSAAVAAGIGVPVAGIAVLLAFVGGLALGFLTGRWSA